MSFLEYRMKSAPMGIAKVLYVHWPLVLLVATVSAIGFLVLYSIAGGDLDLWAGPQMKRFGVGVVMMFAVGFVPIRFWRNTAVVSYVIGLILLVAVELFGVVGMGAQRWLDIGPLRLQPSELMKVMLVVMLAAYYDWLDPKKVSRLFWVILPVLLIIVPTFLVVIQPNLGTSIMLLLGGAAVMFAAGVSIWYFIAVIALVGGAVAGVFLLRDTPWQFLHDYQYRRIDTFLDPSADPLGAGYNIMQAKIALGSGGWSGKGFMQGTQSRLNFLPEKHTDFIFTTLGEEFGYVGAMALLGLYFLILFFMFASAMRNRDRFSALMVLGLGANFFLYIAVNMSMVMGMAPVVGVPLPLLSYGGSAMLVLLFAFGLVQSAHIHRLR